MDAWRGLNTTNNTWANGFAQLDVYKERVSYDANGNILRYLRHGNKTGTPVMDSLSYGYTYNAGKLANNRLNQVRDNVTDAAYADDIDNQSADNYTYDAIGNLMSDAKDSISNIQWNVYGKIMEIQRIPSAARPVSNIRYSYDAAGNRIGKRVAKYNSTAVDYTWYVRDASGNVMGTYGYTSTGTNDLSGANLMQNEVYLYGSSRLGALAVNRNVEDTLQPRDSSLSLPLGLGNLIKGPFVRGIKQYELSNHLGNVLVTISDRKLGVDDGTKDGVVDWYVADVVTANDYYPFGMMMPGRKFAQAGKDYRYSINGQEKELNENITTALYWEYDSRLGRRWNVDPVTKESESPYATFGNNPIWNIDPNGADTLKYLNNNQALDAMKIAAKTLKTAICKKQKIVEQGTSNTVSTLTNEVKGSLVDAADAYAETNSLSVSAGCEFNNLVQDYAEGLRRAYQYGGEKSFNDIAKYLDAQGNSKTSSTFALRKVITRVLEIELRYCGVVNAATEAAKFIATAGLLPNVGASPRIVIGLKPGPALRQAYVTEVEGIKKWVTVMRGQGCTSEQIARATHLYRRLLGVKYKDLTPPRLLETIYKRNLEKYNDRLGPTIEWLRGKGKSWDDIIESSSRSGGKDINFNQ
jgi:RHS repeat-associated protein